MKKNKLTLKELIIARLLQLAIVVLNEMFWIWFLSDVLIKILN